MPVELRIGTQQGLRRTATARPASLCPQPVDGGRDVGDHAGGPARRAARAAAQSLSLSLSHDRPRAGVGGDRRDQCIEPADPEVVLSGALLAATRDFDDEFVDIDQYPSGIDTRDHQSASSEGAQEPRRDGVELPGVPECEFSEERS